MTQPIPHYVHWTLRCVGGNERLNPGPKDRNLTTCGGFTRVNASSIDEAEALFKLAFDEGRMSDGWIDRITLSP